MHNFSPISISHFTLGKFLTQAPDVELSVRFPTRTSVLGILRNRPSQLETYLSPGEVKHSLFPFAFLLVVVSTDDPEKSIGVEKIY